ncbi:MAG: hypothetical protein ACLTG4_03010 [Oscillospiraceae bacterium]
MLDRSSARAGASTNSCSSPSRRRLQRSCAASAGGLNRRLAADPENRHLQWQLSRVYLAQISTVHSFCAALLRDYAHVLELPADFRLETSRRQPPCGSAPCAPFSRRPMPIRRPPCAALDLPGAGRDDRALQELIVRVYTNLQCYPRSGCDGGPLEVMLDVTDCTDPGQTIWGEWLLRELQRGLHRRCGHAAPRAGAC